MENTETKRRAYVHSHSHISGMLSIDVYAQQSRLKNVSPVLKLCFSLAALVICVTAGSPVIGAFVAVTMLCAVILFGGATVGYALSLMRIPVLFICISCAAIACNLSAEPLGYFDIALFGGFLSVTPASLSQAWLLFCRAYGAVTCLYFLSLTTPMQDIIGVLRRLRLPDIVIELMYLIYRYIFVLLDSQGKMTVAASSRLGYSSRKAWWYTFSHIGGNLLAASFRRSGTCFDAMESRCYQGRLSFLTHTAAVQVKHAAILGAHIIFLLGLTFLLKTKGADLF